MAKSELHVGRSLRDMASEAAEAWKAAESGQTVSPRFGIYFRDLSALNAVLTPARYELLRHLRREPASGVHALAHALGRDLESVDNDVVALAELGLLTRGTDGNLSSDVDEIDSTIPISPSPIRPSNDIPSEMRDLAEKSVDQARLAFDGFMTAAQKAAGHADHTAADVQTNAQTIGTKAMGFVESNIRSAFDLASKLVRAKDLQEVLTLQTDYAKTQMTTMEEQARALGTIVQTTAQGAVQAASPKARKRRERTGRQRV